MADLSFQQPLMHNGEPNPSRWLSKCGTFSIQKFTYYRGSPSDPYFQGYWKKSGSAITKKEERLSFDQAVARIEEVAACQRS